MQNAALYKKGIKIRREVLGMKRENERMRDEDEFSRPLREFTTRYVWGEIWARKGLTRKTRRLISMGILIALNCHDELKSHVRSAITDGCTKAEIREVLLQSAVYCGVPAMRGALRATREVFAESKK